VQRYDSPPQLGGATFYFQSLGLASAPD
jgi:hypothetical protein